VLSYGPSHQHDEAKSFYEISRERARSSSWLGDIQYIHQVYKKIENIHHNFSAHPLAPGGRLQVKLAQPTVHHDLHFLQSFLVFRAFTVLLSADIGEVASKDFRGYLCRDGS
jgi:hypothetical protein